jgi:hypothetical protein
MNTQIASISTSSVNPSARVGELSRSPLKLRRIIFMRVGYLVMGGGLAATKWPALLGRSEPWPLYEGVSTYMLVAMGLLALIGLSHPIKMLPILLFECMWKVTWLAAVAGPLWIRGEMDAETSKVATATLWVTVVLAAVPWPYVFTQYLRTKRGSPDVPTPTKLPLDL